MMKHSDLHPSERVEIGVCDLDSHCVTPGVRRKLNVHHARSATGWLVPVMATCKGCARQSRKSSRRAKKFALSA